MGIDIYARYRGQTPEGVSAQITGFASSGGAGYLREAFHGGPYVTAFLVPEAFVTGEAQIPAATLRRRLAEALRLVEQRQRVVYHETSADKIKPMLDSYVAFVEFCECAEQLTGEPVTIIASY